MAAINNSKHQLHTLKAALCFILTIFTCHEAAINYSKHWLCTVKVAVCFIWYFGHISKCGQLFQDFTKPKPMPKDLKGRRGREKNKQTNKHTHTHSQNDANELGRMRQ